MEKKNNNALIGIITAAVVTTAAVTALITNWEKIRRFIKRLEDAQMEKYLVVNLKNGFNDEDDLIL